METAREAEGRKNRWLSLAETMDILGRSAKTVYQRGKELGAKGIGHNVFYDRKKVEALARRAKEAEEETARLAKTHLSAEEAAKLIDTKSFRVGIFAEMEGIPVVRVKHPFVMGKPRVFVERAALLRRLGLPESAPARPEERNRAIDAALNAYAEDRDMAGLHSALGGFARGELEQAAVRYRVMLNKARERANEETTSQAYPIGDTLGQKLREIRKREGARVSARGEHNRILAMESALREVIDKRGVEIRQKGTGRRPPEPSAERKRAHEILFGVKLGRKI